MGGYGSVWGQVWKYLKENRDEGFQAFYIITYQKIYHIITDTVWDQDRAEQLLEEFYIKIFSELEKGPKETASEEEVLVWMEDTLHQYFGIPIPDEKEKKLEEKYLSEEKAATLFFHIEEKLGLSDREEEGSREEPPVHKKKIGRKMITVLPAAAVLFLAFVGTWKIKGLIGQWGESMRVILASETEVPEPEFAAGKEKQTEKEPEKEEEKTLEVGDWSVQISETGEIIETEKMERSVAHGAVQEAEAQDGEQWTVMLLTESAFPDADSSLRNHLICREKNGDSYGLIAEDAEDFCIDGNVIYYADENGVKTEPLITLAWLEQKNLDFSLVMKTDGFYMLNALGEPERESYVREGDRLLRIDEGYVKYAVQAEERLNGLTFYLAEADKDVGAELCVSDGAQARVFQKGKRWIDSFCTADGWIYFSAYEELDENKLRYSCIYRVKPDGTELQPVTGLFQGNVTAMYYFPEEGAVYGEFKPDSYHRYYGQIVRISINGDMKIIDSKSARSSKKTAGNDVLELLDVENGKIFCYWHDCLVSGTEVEILWTRPIMLEADEG